MLGLYKNSREAGKRVKPLSISDIDREHLLSIVHDRRSRLWEVLKAEIVLRAARGLGHEAIGRVLSCSSTTARRWRLRWEAKGMDGLKDKPRSGAPIRVDPKKVIELLHHPPRSFDVNRSTWTCSTLAAVYEAEHGESASKATISRCIRSKGYSFKKAREVLTSNDPQYYEKVHHLLEILHSLGNDQRLFFVDELGPVRVKMHGGRSYMRKDQEKKVPKVQFHKGSICVTGALCATTNQMTWFYCNAKDSKAMIDMIEILFNQYYQMRTLYLTWDAASWHRSEELTGWLDKFNDETTEEGGGPKIQFVPLPSNAQFLNIIEAVFSSMKRAIIHNSDYSSAEEMKMAISQHFRERNDFFRRNPRRAGNKIWDIDFFKNCENIRSGNYREW